MTLFNYRFGTTMAAGQYISWKTKIQKKDSRKPNILKFQTLQTSTPVLNDEVKYFDLTNTQIFGGYVQNVEKSNGIQSIEVADYSIKLSQEPFSDIHLALSPEAIIEYIINTYTDLTYSSSVATGITIERIIFKDDWIVDGITKLIELFNGTYTVDLSKNFVMRIAATNLCTKDLLYGRDFLSGPWTTDIQKLVEKVIVIGAIIDQRTTETLSGTGTLFETTWKPENIEITGLQQTTTDIKGDYVVDVENKKITFNTSKTDPVVSYSYKSQVRAEYGEGKSVILEKKYIESKFEARRLAFEYYERFKDGSQSSKWLKMTSDIDLYNVGDKILVTDEKNNRTGYYEISAVTLELPNKLILQVGEGEDDLFDWQKEAIERIKQLEKSKTNAEYITKYDFVKSPLNVNAVFSFTELLGIIDGGVVLWASDTALASDGDLISDDGDTPLHDNFDSYDVVKWTDPQPSGVTIVSDELNLQSTNLVNIEVLSNDFFTYKTLKVRARITDNFNNFLNAIIGFYEVVSLYDYIRFEATSANIIYATSRVNDAGEQTNIGAVDTNYHDFEIQWKAGEVKFYVDGVLKATHTVYVPSIPLQIQFKNRALSSVTSNLSIDWVQTLGVAMAFDDGSIPEAQLINYLT